MTKSSPLTPGIGHPHPIGNPHFSPGLSPKEFPTLRIADCEYASKFVTKEKWPTIPELRDPSGPFQLTFWNAVQIHHFLQSIPDPHSFDGQLTTFEEYFSDEGSLPQVLSKTYALLNTSPEQSQLPYLSKWETDLHRTFTAPQKENMIRFSLKSSLCTKIQETNLKILMRWYLTPSQLHTIFPNTPEHCWRCQRATGTMLHIFWTCPKLTGFWTAVRANSQKFRLPNSPQPGFLPIPYLNHPP